MLPSDKELERVDIEHKTSILRILSYNQNYKYYFQKFTKTLMFDYIFLNKRQKKKKKHNLKMLRITLKYG